MSQTPTNMSELIEQAAAEPSRARDQAVEVQNRSLGELIEADKHLRRTAASKSPLAGLFRAKIKYGKPGGIP